MLSLFAASELFDLIEKVEKGERLDHDAGIRLLNSRDILALGYMANLVRERKNGNQTFFIVKRHFVFTNDQDAMLFYGKGESAEEWLDQLLHLRIRQDQTGKYRSLIPLPFYPEAELLEGTMGVGTTTGIEDLKALAIARILLDNFEHIKTFWSMLGLKLTQVSLAFGVDDLEGNIVAERVKHSGETDLSQVITKRAMIHMIQKAGRTAIERDKFYRVLKID